MHLAPTAALGLASRHRLAELRNAAAVPAPQPEKRAIPVAVVSCSPVIVPLRTAGDAEDTVMNLSPDTIATRADGGVLHATFNAPPMNLIGPEVVRDLES